MGIFDELKAVGNVLQEAGKIEQYKQILEAQAQLLEMQTKLGQLEKENLELKDKLSTKAKLLQKNHAYWSQEADKEDGPFCTRCWDVEKQLVRLHPMGNPAYYDCPNCKSGSVLIKPELDIAARQFRQSPVDDGWAY